MVSNRGPELQAVCATFLALALITTATRCYVRAYIVRSFGYDDWFMVAASLFHIMFATCAITGAHYGTGRHYADLTPANIVIAMRYWWLCYIAYTMTMIMVKISIGLFLLRVIVSRVQRCIVYLVVGTTVVVGIVFLFVTVFQCSPVAYFWDRGLAGKCFDMEVIIGLTYFYGTVNAICDFTFGLLPVFLVWNLEMDKRVKIVLIPILGMGCLASIAVLVRMAYLQEFRDPDFLYATVDIAIWSDVEIGLAITAGSLACLRPLFHIIASKFGLSTSRRSRGDNHVNSVRRSTRAKPKISGPLALVKFSTDSKVILSSTDDVHPGWSGGEGYSSRDKHDFVPEEAEAIDGESHLIAMRPTGYEQPEPSITTRHAHENGHSTSVTTF